MWDKETINTLVNAGIGTLALIVLLVFLAVIMLERRNDKRRIELQSDHDKLRLQLESDNEKLRLEIEKASVENEKAGQAAQLITAENTKLLVEAQIQSQVDHIATVRAIEENSASRRAQLEIDAKQAEILNNLVTAQNSLDANTRAGLDKAIGTITDHIDVRNKDTERVFVSISKDINATAGAMHDIENDFASLDKKTATLPETLTALMERIQELPAKMGDELKKELDDIRKEITHLGERIGELSDKVAAVPRAVPDTPKNGDVQHVIERDGIDTTQTVPGSDEVAT